MLIYEVDQRIAELLENSVDPETGELIIGSEELSEKLAQLNVEREAAIEGLAISAKNATALADVIRQEELALANRRRKLERKVERLRGYLAYYLDGQKFSTARCAVSFRRTQNVDIDDDFVEWAAKHADNLLRFKEPEPDRVAIKKAIQSGQNIQRARIVESVSMTIR